MLTLENSTAISDAIIPDCLIVNQEYLVALKLFWSETGYNLFNSLVIKYFLCNCKS